MMQIFYFCPDLDFPSGGIKRIYNHVELLNDNGFNARILHFKKGFSPSWFSANVPVSYLDDQPPIEPGDTVVVPEGFPNVMKKFKTVSLNRIVIALSFIYPFQSLPLGTNWTDYNFTTVLASSRQVAEIIKWAMGIRDIHVIKTSIDAKNFYFDPTRKKNQIAWIARKDTNTPLVEKIIRLRYGADQKYEFIKIENLDYAEYAQTLRESKIYLSTSPYEAMNRSVLEAMACGCLCAGYHGFGGKEFIIGDGGYQNFFLTETMDFIHLAQTIDKLITDIQNEEYYLERIRQNALNTAKRYESDQEKESLLRFWADYSARFE